MSVVSAAATLAAPWAHLYNDSKLLSTGVTFIHLGGLLLGGGFAIAADRATLRLPRVDSSSLTLHLTELHSIHRPVLIGLGLTFVSGLLLLGADVKTFLPAPLFWIKMGVIVLLLGNGAMLQQAETRLRLGTTRADVAWRRLRSSAWLSLGLWFGSLLLGTALLSI
jgi:hypothetical protein